MVTRTADGVRVCGEYKPPDNIKSSKQVKKDTA